MCFCCIGVCWVTVFFRKGNSRKLKCECLILNCWHLKGFVPYCCWFSCLFNPVALRRAKTRWSFGCSECNRVNSHICLSGSSPKSKGKGSGKKKTPEPEPEPEPEVPTGPPPPQPGSEEWEFVDQKIEEVSIQNYVFASTNMYEFSKMSKEGQLLWWLSDKSVLTQLPSQKLHS